MVCIAAFIILCLISLFVGILSIFRRDIGRKYWRVFKKAWGCVGKKLTLQKCETNFKDDIKNSVLKKVVIKKPKLVKPISVGIEIAAVLIVLVAAWSLVEGAKAGLSLWSLGTCNVTQPSACTLGAETCSIDQEKPKNPIEAVGRWFTDWGEIFSRIPDKFRNWDTNNFSELSGFRYTDNQDQITAIDILDPGCVVCLQSFKNQKDVGFFDAHTTLIVPYAIQNPDGSYKFKNSEIVTRYLLTIAERNPQHSVKILENIFTMYNEDHIIYQSVFNEKLDHLAASEQIWVWLKELKYTGTQISNIAMRANSQTITDQIAKNKEIVENEIHANGIPTMIYDGKKHTGLYKAQ